MTAIEFNHISKMYQLGVVGTETLSRDINRWWQINVLGKPDPYLKIGQINDRSSKGNSEFVYALKDIDFKVEQGDVVGIIGKNGAGKSTLLKLLSRITAPTTGTIKARGRIASLLEVGTGFHPELTGRENIYMNGAIMGMTKREIDTKLDEIIDFSGCEMYIDTPVKRYSSGMTVRLGFAVASFLEPEILVVDEVLAVGDAEFQNKAIGKMQDVAANSGRTVLFVSHNMASVLSLCKSGVVLKNGMVDYIGTAKEAVERYISTNVVFDGGRIIDKISYLKHTLRIDSIEFNGTESTRSVVKSGQSTIKARIAGHTDEKLITDLKVIFKTRSETPMASLADGHTRGIMMTFPKGDFVIEREIVLPKYLSEGTYLVDINLHHPMVEWQMRCLNAISLEVSGFFEGYGRALILEHEGMMGLEIVE